MTTTNEQEGIMIFRYTPRLLGTCIVNTETSSRRIRTTSPRNRHGRRGRLFNEGYLASKRRGRNLLLHAHLLHGLLSHLHLHRHDYV